MHTYSITIMKDKVVIIYKDGKTREIDKRGLIGPTKELLRDFKVMTRSGTVRSVVR